LYDLINLQIAEAASGRRKPVFEVAEMTDAHLLLMDLHQPQCGTIYQYPPFVLSLLSRLRILENRRVIFNGLSADPYEIQHIFGKFKMLKKQSKNRSISEMFEKLKLTYPCLVQKKNIRKS
jgi:hypothetical protein